MKHLITVLFSLGVVFSAQANDTAFDCRTSWGHPQGGKYCHYMVPQCAKPTCEEAAKCIVKSYASNILWKSVSNLKVVNSSDVVMAGEALNVKIISADSEAGKVMRSVVLKVEDNSCEPVAVY